MGKGGAIAGVAVTAIAAVAVVLAFAGRSGAAAQSTLTVDVPAPVTDTIYAAPEARGRPIIVIDAGHGGRDPGATSVSGQVNEKDLTLALARELRDDLVKRGRVRVAMTRNDDRYLTLDQRAAVARRLNAALFVSLHMDSAPNPLARGATVYSLSDVASDAEAARLAAAQNAGAESDSRAARSRACSPTSRCRRRCARRPISRRGSSARRADGSSFGPIRTASLPSTCFAVPRRRPCCSSPGTSAMPTMK